MRSITSAGVAGMFSAVAAGQVATFSGLGTVGKTGGIIAPNSTAAGVSADGAVVAGKVMIWDGFHAIEKPLLARWTAGAGWTTGMMGWNQAVSADGSSLAGIAYLSLTLASPHLERNGVVVGNGLMDGIFYALSADGMVAVGESGSDAIRWTAAGGPQMLGHIPGFGAISASARGVTADGAIVVGVDSGPGGSQAFKWTAAGGMVGLGYVAGASSSSAAAISADGRVIVGTSGSQGFICTPWKGMEALPLLPGFTSGDALAVSGDGSVVVGRTRAGQAAPIAYYWDRARGKRDLKAFMLSLGATGLSGWSLRSATGISPDGSVIVGNGVNPQGLDEAWLARIPAFCYANCDGSTAAPVINVNDFVCFLNRFAVGDPYTNCDWSAVEPALNVLDFVCFLNRFAAGCP